MTKKDAWKKDLPKAARMLLAARTREYKVDRPKAFPHYEEVAWMGTAAYVKKVCELNSLIH